MEKKTLQTEKGRIVYWTSGPDQSGGDKDTGIRIVFLPGLSADRRLFGPPAFRKTDGIFQQIMELPCLGPSCTWRIETVQPEFYHG